MSTSSARYSVNNDLRLHVGLDGVVWYWDGKSTRTSSCSPEEFVKTSMVQRAKRIRFLGTHANASLIRGVYIARSGDIPSNQITIASPRVGIRHESDEPSVVFSRMATNTWPSSVGGWRQVTSHDFVIYSLIAEIQKAKGVVTKSALLYLKQHPAWPAVSFVYRHQWQPACRLLTEIIDPRWHIDVDDPERYAQLRNYLGFGSTIKEATGKISAAVNLLRGHDGACPPCDDVRLYRTMLTVASWFGGFIKDPALENNLGKYLHKPAAFLLRYLYDPREEERHDVRFVRANHRFIRFVRAVWLDNLYLHRRYRTVTQKFRKHSEQTTRRKLLAPKGYERTLFIPQHFFVESDEVLAWKEHTTRLRRASK